MTPPRPSVTASGPTRVSGAIPGAGAATRRAVFLDVDGTLVDHAGQVPPSARDAVRAARANGHLVFLCTGRSRPQLWPAITDIGFDGLVASAGAYVEMGGVELVHRRLDAGQIRRISDYFDRHGVDYVFEGAEGLFGTEGVQARLRGLLRGAVPDAAELAELQRGFFAYIDRIQVAEQPLTAPVSKVVFLWGPGVALEEIRHAFAAEFQVIASPVPLFGANVGEMQMVGVHKASGIDRVTEHLGIARGQTIAIGDSDNDLEMLRHAHVGIAMRSAAQHVRDAADEVTSAPEEDGILEAFVRHGLVDA